MDAYPFQLNCDWAVRVVTPPAVRPVTTAQLRKFANLDEDDTSEDDILELICDALVEYAENTLTGRAYVERTLELSLSHIPYGLQLPYAPLLGINSIGYLDDDAVEQPVSSADYIVDTALIPGRIAPYRTYTWPTPTRHHFRPYRINYQAGYRSLVSPSDATSKSHLPATLRLWLAARTLTLFDNREHFVVGASIAKIPRDMSDALLDGLVLGSRLF